jgi:type IV pilus assembly protein PilV
VHRRSVGGFTLVEVLVALFVVAVGVVGAAGTQMAAQRTRHQAALMSDAVQLAASLSERMRANQVAMAAAGNPYLQLRYDAASDGAPAPGVTCFGDAECNPSQMAEFDLYETRLAIHAGFPRGRIVVCRDAAIQDAGSKVLAWACEEASNAPIVVKLGWRGNEAGADAPSVAMVVPG